MPSAAVWTGRILILIGILGYAYGLYSGKASFTALIPAVFGIVIIALGHFSQARESISKHLMHAAMLVGLLGFVLPAGRLLSKFSELSFSAAVISQAAMALVCLIFVLMGVRSFIQARQK